MVTSKHPAPRDVERIRLAFDSILDHLGRENHRFVFGHGARGARAQGIAPIEVKAEENLRAKSLRLLCEKYGLRGIRTSMSSYREQDWLTNVPLWAIGALFMSDESL